MPALAAAARAGPADVVGEDGELNDGRHLVVVLHVPDDALLVDGEGAALEPARLGLGDPVGGLLNLRPGNPGDALRLGHELVVGHGELEAFRLVLLKEGHVRAGLEVGHVVVALLPDRPGDGVGQDVVRAQVGPEEHHPVRGHLGRHGVGAGLPGVNDDEVAGLGGLARVKGLLLLRHRGPLDVGEHVLHVEHRGRLVGVRSPEDDGVGEAGVLVGVVQLVDAPLPASPDLGVVGGAVVDGDVLHGEGGEEELPGGVVVLKALARAPVVEALHGDVVVVAVPVPDALDEEAHEGEGVLPGDGLELVAHPEEG